MTSLGRKFREERVRRGLTLGEIAERTRISSKHLEAIEEDQLDRLPAGYFRRSFVRQYANALEITGPEVDAALQEVVAEPAPEELARAVMGRPERAPQRPPPRRLALLLVPAAALAAGSGLYFWWKRRMPVERVVASAPAPKMETAAPVAPPTPPPKQLPPPEAAQAEAPATARVSITLAALDQTWISFTAEGKTVFSGVLDKGQTKTLEGAERARLVVGNAAGLEVRWNGKVIEPLGPRGHIREVLFTRENYQIRALRKPES